MCPLCHFYLRKIFCCETLYQSCPDAMTVIKNISDVITIQNLQVWAKWEKACRPARETFLGTFTRPHDQEVHMEPKKTSWAAVFIGMNKHQPLDQVGGLGWA